MISLKHRLAEAWAQDCDSDSPLEASYVEGFDQALRMALHIVNNTPDEESLRCELEKLQGGEDEEDEEE